MAGFQEGINRNILECKDHHIGIYHQHRCGVLIETYWNVKLYPFSPPFSLLRINRNILECKGQTRSNDNEDDGY